MFCGTKRMCDQLAMNLSREYRAAAIHGDKKQQERDAVLAAFKVSAQDAGCVHARVLQNALPPSIVRLTAVLLHVHIPVLAGFSLFKHC